MTHSTSPLLSVDRVSLSFKGVKAVTDISFAVQSGEICALIGPNGAGKSSLLNVINGVYLPQEGSVAFDNRRFERMKPWDAAHLGISRTFQNIALFRRMTVLENVLTGRTLHRTSGWVAQTLGLPSARRDVAAQRDAAETLIEALDLQPYRDTVVGSLSYGVQKRVELARALAATPRLLLLDEPMAGMNPEEKAAMVDYIIDANTRQGVTVLLIEHDIGVVMSLSDHVVVLDYGKKIADGAPADVRAHPDVIAAYLGTRH
ncbi:ABC transporter ATP-binding protein [Pararobbsia silviterrae]|uniref:ABC transporter ATP-binding protein n=1 Tax=Pararobbsia silviterrae TaxID=1792498 RepID=A0A494Y939_9BURK|nr:ABC transporter ATP-binding protein [Pararobbsia silviterrae]RKP58866.1 ABC transporter ATP-binding protein [Pararobbsia silviterrae]